MRYKVYWTNVVEYLCTVEVEASNEDEALARAIATDTDLMEKYEESESRDEDFFVEAIEEDNSDS